MKIGKPSHATVVAYLALVAAIGGSAYAASKVGTADLKDNAVTSPKIDNFAIKAKDLETFRLRSERFDGGTGPGTLSLSCKKTERLISGSGGWVNNSAGTIVSTNATRRAYAISVNSPSPGSVVVRALCMPE